LASTHTTVFAPGNEQHWLKSPVHERSQGHVLQRRTSRSASDRSRDPRTRRCTSPALSRTRRGPPCRSPRSDRRCRKSHSSPRPSACPRTSRSSRPPAPHSPSRWCRRRSSSSSCRRRPRCSCHCPRSHTPRGRAGTRQPRARETSSWILQSHSMGKVASDTGPFSPDSCRSRTAARRRSCSGSSRSGPCRSRGSHSQHSARRR